MSREKTVPEEDLASSTPGASPTTLAPATPAPATSAQGDKDAGHAEQASPSELSEPVTPLSPSAVSPDAGDPENAGVPPNAGDLEGAGDPDAASAAVTGNEPPHRTASEPAAAQDAETAAPRWDPEPQREPSALAPTSPPVSGAASAQAEPSAQPGLAARSFALCAAVGPLVLLVLWAIQSLPVLMGRELHALYALASGTYEGLFVEILASADGVAGLTEDVPRAVLPVFGWFLAALERIPGLDSLAALLPTASDPLAVLMSVATVLTTLFLVLLTWALARATGNDARTAFAAGLVLLVGLTFMGLPAFAGDALLFAGILTLTSLCLYRGWIKTSAPLWLLCGFAGVALATLSGGLAGLILPLLVSLLFLVWRCTFRRGGARDGALGFGFMLVLLCVWGTSVAFSDGGRDQLARLLNTVIMEPASAMFRSQGRELSIAFPVLALLWLPWLLLFPFLPWERVGTFLGNSVHNRTQRPGQGWIWWSLLGGVVILGLLGAGDPLYLLPVLPPLAILTAQGMLSLSARRSRGFGLLLAVLLILLGVAFLVAAVYPLIFDAVPPALAALHPVALPGLLGMIGSCVIFGLLLWKVVNRASASGSLLALTVLAVVLAAPFSWYAAPVATMSPETAPAEQGFAPENTMPEVTPAVPAAPAVPEVVPAPAVPAAPAAPEAAPAAAPTPPAAPVTDPVTAPADAPVDAPADASGATSTPATPEAPSPSPSVTPPATPSATPAPAPEAAGLPHN